MTNINSSPAYVTVHCEPSYSLFDTEYIYTAFALSRTTNQGISISAYQSQILIGILAVLMLILQIVLNLLRVQAFMLLSHWVRVLNALIFLLSIVLNQLFRLIRLMRNFQAVFLRLLRFM